MPQAYVTCKSRKSQIESGGGGMLNPQNTKRVPAVVPARNMYPTHITVRAIFVVNFTDSSF